MRTSNYTKQICLHNDIHRYFFPACKSLPIQPDNSVKVQMVGRLVQHQQSGLHKERPTVT